MSGRRINRVNEYIEQYPIMYRLVKLTQVLLTLKERNYINFSKSILQKRYNFELSLFQENQILSVGLLKIYSKENPWIQRNYEISNEKHTS